MVNTRSTLLWFGVYKGRPTSKGSSAEWISFGLSIRLGFFGRAKLASAARTACDWCAFAEGAPTRVL